MKDDLKPETIAELNTYSLDPNYSARPIYRVFNPRGELEEKIYYGFRSVLNDFEGTDVFAAVLKEYNENKESNFDEEDFDNYYFDNFKRVAEDIGYRIMGDVK